MVVVRSAGLVSQGRLVVILWWTPVKLHIHTVTSPVVDTELQNDLLKPAALAMSLMKHHFPAEIGEGLDRG